MFAIKVFSKKEYRDDFINGRLYLNEAGFFNRLEDNFRGDKYDSKIVEFNATIIVNGQTFYPDVMVQGFVGDDKVPILSMTLLQENILCQLSEKQFKLKKEVIDELSKFGKYGLFYSYGELRKNIEEYAKEYDIGIKSDIVSYVDMKKDKEYFKYYKNDLYAKYFIKDISYQLQNEVRIIFLSNNTDKFTPLIAQDEDHIIISIKPFEWFYEFNIEDNLELGF